MVRTLLLAALLLASALPAEAADFAPIKRRLPPEGLAIPPAIEKELREATEALRLRFEKLRPDRRAPDYFKDSGDVLIFVKAVDFALRHREFYAEKDFDTARKLLAEGHRRCDALARDERPWTTQKGRVVRGYMSSLDDSPQPYGLEIPEEIDLASAKPAKVPLYVWLHGRGDKQTDLHFIHERMTRPGQIAPKGAIVVHPFGRQCLGYKSAGEQDVDDVAFQVKMQYPVDGSKVVLIGFSMGGAGAWHLGAHFPHDWVAIAPGAGFAETQRYQKLDPARVPWYEQALWGQYDAPAYARNLLNRPVIAYSGELDPQKQAALVMEEAFAANGAKLKHVIGPGMGHKYHPDSLKEILEFTQAACDAATSREPTRVYVQTRTLRYPQAEWVSARGLAEHWREARIDAEVRGNEVRLTTSNVTVLSLVPPIPQAPYRAAIDGQVLDIAQEPADGITLAKRNGKWVVADSADFGTDAPGKTAYLQGPIDDAFSHGRLLVVRPTGKCRSPAVQKWVDFELAHFLDRWRATFRGEAPVKDDVDVTGEDMMFVRNVILWGDDQSNKLIARANGKLPIRWEGDEIVVGEKRFSAAGHVPLLICKNPLELPVALGSIRGYIVLNSGPTFREAHDATNSQQNPKLPDWAIVDLSQPPDDRSPGKIVAADFFDEEWKLKPFKEPVP